MRRWLFILVLCLAAAPGLQAANTRATLLLPVDTARPGDTVLAGVRLQMNPGWHTYWRNPGSSGMATEIKWSLPDSIRAGNILWPPPEHYETEGLITYVHHDEVILLVPLEISATAQPGSVTLKAQVSWLECEVLCVPGSAGVSASLTIGDESKPSRHASRLAAAEKLLPKDGAGLGAQAAWDGPAMGDTRSLLIHWPRSAPIADADFFSYPAETYEVQFETDRLALDDGGVLLRKQVKKFSGDWPNTLAGLLVGKAGEAPEAYEVTLAVHPDAEALAVAGLTTAASSRDPGGLWINLLLALGGGLILNLMPCVLPILSLKVLSLIRQGAATAGERRQHGLVYTAGVLVSFWAIGGLVVAGRLASWGEQFQDPRFIIIVTALMTVVALNLFGVFEVILPGTAVTSATQLASRGGAGGAFFNGVLAVVLGASCVAPLLAAAIGWAISQPPLAIMLIFTMIGLGLALPFLLLSFVPALQAFLPRPGAWMEKFKVVMGFPMLATAVWLLSLTADQFGSRGPLWVGLFLVMLALALWVYGTFIQRGTRRKSLALVLALGFVGFGYGYALEKELDWRRPSLTATASGEGLLRSEVGIPWEPWSTEAVARARTEGRPVLVDFTANWCLTCKLNKKTSLEIPAVRDKLAAINAVALVGDYTRRNPDITAELHRFERAGVPLVLVYPQDASQPPVVLPTVLTPGIVLEALQKAVN